MDFIRLPSKLKLGFLTTFSSSAEKKLKSFLQAINPHAPNLAPLFRPRVKSLGIILDSILFFRIHINRTGQYHHKTTSAHHWRMISSHSTLIVIMFCFIVCHTRPSINTTWSRTRTPGSSEELLPLNTSLLFLVLNIQDLFACKNSVWTGKCLFPRNYPSFSQAHWTYQLKETGSWPF